MKITILKIFLFTILLAVSSISLIVTLKSHNYSKELSDLVIDKIEEDQEKHEEIGTKKRFSDIDMVGEYCGSKSLIAIIEINGAIDVSREYGMFGATAFSDEILPLIDFVETDNRIKGLIVSINSPGGTGVPGEEISNALKKLSKPSVAVVRNEATSAAYLIATGTQRIFASEFSEIGSIGVIQIFVDESERLKKEGLKIDVFKSGKYKDFSWGLRALTSNEKKIIQDNLDVAHVHFVKMVSQNMGLDIEEVKKIATGQSFSGAEALKLRLVDEIGTIDDAEIWLYENKLDVFSYKTCNLSNMQYFVQSQYLN